MESFGSRLAQLRKSRNMTQEDLAERLNISAQAVSKWENDLTSPDLETLLKLAEIFGVSTDELLGRIKTEAHLAEIHEKKDINQMLLHIDVDSADGDRVRINLPMAIIKVLVESGAAMNFLGGKASLENIDWNASQRDTVKGWLSKAGTTEAFIATPNDVTLNFPYQYNSNKSANLYKIN